MNLLFGALGIGAVVCLLRFLMASCKDEKVSTSHNVRIYLVDEKSLGVHKITARRYGKFTIMDGGAAAQRSLPCSPRKQNVIAGQLFFLTEQPGTKRSTLRQG